MKELRDLHKNVTLACTHFTCGKSLLVFWGFSWFVHREASTAVGRFTTPSDVLMDRTLAMPSFSGCKAMIRPSLHRSGGKFSSFSTTMVPTPKCSEVEALHLCRCWSWWRWSGYHRFQGCCCMAWRSWNRLKRLILTSVTPRYGRAVSGRLIRKCLGIKEFRSAGSADIGRSGRELIHDSTCVGTV